MMVAQPSGRWGPCCSQVPTGMMRRGSRARISDTMPGGVYLSSRAWVAGACRGREAVISNQNEVSVTPRAAHGTGVTTLWTLVAGVTLVAGGWWLRTPSVGYLAFTVAATVASLVLAVMQRRGARGWAVASAAVLAAFAVLASTAQRNLTRIDDDWPAYRALIVQRGGAELRQAIAQSLVDLQSKATRALEVPGESRGSCSSIGACRSPGAGGSWCRPIRRAVPSARCTRPSIPCC